MLYIYSEVSFNSQLVTATGNGLELAGWTSLGWLLLKISSASPPVKCVEAFEMIATSAPGPIQVQKADGHQHEKFDWKLWRASLPPHVPIGTW